MTVTTSEDTAVSTGGPPASGKTVYTVVPRRSVLSWIIAALTLLITVSVVLGLAGNESIKWSIVGDYLFSDQILRGVGITIQMAVLSMLFGILLGVGIGLGRLSSNKVIAGICSGYVLLFRGIPVLLQLLIWGNIGLFLRTVDIGVPFTDISFFQAPTNELLFPFAAAVVGLALHEAAYMGEIIRGGIQGIDPGQREAATALGMAPGRAMRRVILPQALRLIIPPTGNQFVTLIKGTSLVSVIAGGDLLTQAQNISATSYRVIEMLAVATVWYLALVAVASLGQHYLERAVSKGAHR